MKRTLEVLFLMILFCPVLYAGVLETEMRRMRPSSIVVTNVNLNATEINLNSNTNITVSQELETKVSYDNLPSITNGLASVQYVVNAVNDATNSLASIKYVDDTINDATNGMASTGYVNDVVNNSTNSLASTKYVDDTVNNVTNNIITNSVTLNASQTITGTKTMNNLILGNVMSANDFGIIGLGNLVFKNGGVSWTTFGTVTVSNGGDSVFKFNSGKMYIGDVISDENVAASFKDVTNKTTQVSIEAKNYTDSATNNAMAAVKTDLNSKITSPTASNDDVLVYSINEWTAKKMTGDMILMTNGASETVKSAIDLRIQKPIAAEEGQILTFDGEDWIAETHSTPTRSRKCYHSFTKGSERYYSNAYYTFITPLLGRANKSFSLYGVSVFAGKDGTSTLTGAVCLQIYKQINNIWSRVAISRNSVNFKNLHAQQEIQYTFEGEEVPDDGTPLRFILTSSTTVQTNPVICATAPILVYKNSEQSDWPDGYTTSGNQTYDDDCPMFIIRFTIPTDTAADIPMNRTDITTIQEYFSLAPHTLYQQTVTATSGYIVLADGVTAYTLELTDQTGDISFSFDGLSAPDNSIIIWKLIIKQPNSVITPNWGQSITWITNPEWQQNNSTMIIFHKMPNGRILGEYKAMFPSANP